MFVAGGHLTTTDLGELGNDEQCATCAAQSSGRSHGAENIDSACLPLPPTRLLLCPALPPCAAHASFSLNLFSDNGPSMSDNYPHE